MTRWGTSPGRCCHRRTADVIIKIFIEPVLNLSRVQVAYETCTSLVSVWEAEEEVSRMPMTLACDYEALLEVCRRAQQWRSAPGVRAHCQI